MNSETELPIEQQAALDKPGTVVPMTSQVIEPNPANLLAVALEKGLDTDTLTKFMDLQERHEANEARKAYAKDMANCQKAMPAIVAQADNSQTSSVYAKLEHINAKITPVYTKHGFSISFSEEPIEGDWIRIAANVLHKMGHFEHYTYDLPLDMAGIKGNANKTAIHAKGSSTTYGRRYLTTMIFNLTIGEDDDGNAAGGESRFITNDQVFEIDAMVSEAGLVHSAIKREFGVDDYAKIPAAKFDKAIARVKMLASKRQA